MSLDFTVLNSISTAKKSQIPPTVYEEGNLALLLQKPATGQNTAPQGELIHSHRLDAEKQERERMREMYSTYQDNIKRAGSLRADILKGIQRGEDPLALLLKAVECISLMTGDTVIYEQSKEDILAIYGWGLGLPEPLHTELKNAYNRLERLKRATVTPEEKPRIERAIRSHEEYIESLQRAIARADRQPELREASDIVTEVIDGLKARQEALYRSGEE